MMTQQEQVSAVLEKMGWTYIHNANTMACSGIWVGYPPKNPIIGKPVAIPDLLHSLDAIAFAEALLEPNEQSAYVELCCDSIRREENIAFGEEPHKKWLLNCFGQFALMTLKCETRLENLCRTWWPEKWK